MTPRPDPYRVLGLVPGASAGEIRSAYRRLAKLHHPDTAGERSLPRFLAIRAAYEALLDGEGRLRGRGGAPRGGASGSGRPPDPSATGASRDAWRARRASGAGGGSDARERAGPRAEADDAGAGGGKAEAGAAGSAKSGPRGSASGGSRRGSGARRSGERRTAKPGSTTYDEASQPLDPSWDGATWYGASSGSYWTLNPREYADPRKHGPEYQERARRAAELQAELRRRASQPDGEPDGDPGDDPDPPAAP